MELIAISSETHTEEDPNVKVQYSTVSTAL
jgi:hypothetical protein